VSGRTTRRRPAVQPVAIPESLAPAPLPPPAPALLYVPRTILRDTHDAFLPYWRAGVETAAYWFGVATGHLAVATTVVLPRLDQSAGHYQVDVASLRRLVANMRVQGLTNLAQVHTHPSAWVGHSAYDDAHAYSTRVGALSLVWPHYGRAYAYDLCGVGVHERRDGQWVHLSAADVANRIRLIDSVADQRWDIVCGDGADGE